MPPDDYNIAPSTFQPVILDPRDYDRWLSGAVPEQPPVDLLRPFDSDDMAMAPANKASGQHAEQRAGDVQ
jgi:putative SOS response-associated peptidase YedK